MCKDGPIGKLHVTYIRVWLNAARTEFAVDYTHVLNPPARPIHKDVHFR